jgi:negative regulator of flagellin synthesis FlgM
MIAPIAFVQGYIPGSLENVMKIGQATDMSVVSTPPAASGTVAVPKSRTGAAAAASQAAESADVSVTVSTQARALERANQTETADVNLEKVNAVRTAIEQGTFVVNPEVIADKLLANAQEMLNRTHN